MTDDPEEQAQLALATTRDGTAVVVDVVGELDAASAPTLDALAERLRADGVDTFTFDVSKTTFIDSSGLRSLLALHTELVAGGKPGLALRAPSDPVVRLLTITGLTEHFRSL